MSNDLKFLLTERQSSYIASVNPDTGKNENERRVYFNGKPENNASIYGMPCGLSCAITIIEDPGNEAAGNLTFCPVEFPAMPSEPKFVEVEITIAVPPAVFQQLLDMDVDETTVWLNLDMTNCTPEQQVAEEKIGHAEVSSSRLSFMLTANTILRSNGKDAKKARAMADFTNRLDRIFWATVVIGALMLYIINILWHQHQ